MSDTNDNKVVTFSSICTSKYTLILKEKTPQKFERSILLVSFTKLKRSHVREGGCNVKMLKKMCYQLNLF